MIGPKMRKRLVVDADLLRAASDAEEASPHAAKCQRILNGILKICHRVVVNDQLEDEWSRHRSLSATQWVNEMGSKKKLDHRTPEPLPLRSLLDTIFDVEAHREAVLKDLHLIELALDADRVVLSLERRCKDLLEQHTGLLSELLWHNPVQDVEATIRWLEAGAQWDEAPAD